MKFILFGILLGIGVLQSRASREELFLQAADAVSALHQFDFLYADSVIHVLENHSSDHYLPHLARANYYWWKIISQEPEVLSEQNYLASLERAEKHVLLLVRKGEYDKQDVFHFINLYAFRARLDLLNARYGAALRQLRQCMRFVRMSLNGEEEYQAFALTSGLYNYMAAYAAERIPLFSIYRLLYPAGDAEKGLRQLHKAAFSENAVLRTEAHYFLMKIYLELENDYSAALPHARWLAEQFPLNMIYQYYYHQVLLFNRLDREAHDVKMAYYTVLKEHPYISTAQKEYLLRLL